jgi:hypothetical protein
MQAHMNVKTVRTAWYIQNVSIEDVAEDYNPNLIM